MTPWTAALQVPLSMEFSGPSGLPFPSAGALPEPGTESTFPAWQVDSLPLSHLGSPSQITKTAGEEKHYAFVSEDRIPFQSVAGI